MELIPEVVQIPAIVPALIPVPAPAWNRLQFRLFESNSDSDSGIGNYQGGVIKGNRTAKPKIQKVPDSIANLTAV